MKTKTCIFAMLLAAGLINSHAQDTWTQKANFGGTARRDPVGFAIGSKGYVGTGVDGSYVKDFCDGRPIVRTANDGRYTDSTGNTGRARYMYWVCEAGTSTCSNNAKVTFQQ